MTLELVKGSVRQEGEKAWKHNAYIDLGTIEQCLGSWLMRKGALVLREVGWERRMLASSVLCPSLTLQTGSPPRDQSLHPSIIFSITQTYVLISTHEGTRPLKRAATSPTSHSVTCGLWEQHLLPVFQEFPKPMTAVSY